MTREYLDIVDENGMPTGETIDREKAHAEGIMHRTSHVWIFRKKGEKIEILLQKRCDDKDSFPGCYDISSAGHIPAGVDFVPSALRELQEELSLDVGAEELICCGDMKIVCDDNFHGKPYHDRQFTRVFVLECDLDDSAFVFQKEEISAVMWMEYHSLVKAVAENTIPHCIRPDELGIIGKKIFAG